VFLSDNGATRYGSNAPLRGGKDDVWEGGVHVPGFARWPGHIEPGVSREFMTSLDVMPTLLDLAGVPIESLDLDGISLGPRLLSGTALPERGGYWEHIPKEGESQVAVRRGDWKLVITGGDPALYDLGIDPAEQHDRADEQAARVDALTTELESWRASLDDS
jgi:arylsulfatase A